MVRGASMGTSCASLRTRRPTCATSVPAGQWRRRRACAPPSRGRTARTGETPLRSATAPRHRPGRRRLLEAAALLQHLDLVAVGVLDEEELPERLAVVRHLLDVLRRQP